MELKDILEYQRKLTQEFRSQVENFNERCQAYLDNLVGPEDEEEDEEEE